MPKPPLPIYQIRDFEGPLRPEPDFYLRRFEVHLQRHDFIQKPHKHDFYLVLVLTRGTGTHTIDFQFYPVTPQSVFFLRPGQVHAWDLSADAAGFILFFSAAFYQQHFPQHQVRRFPFFHAFGAPPLLLLPENQRETVLQLLADLEAEYTGRDWQQEPALAAYLQLLLIRLGRLVPAPAQPEGPAAGPASSLQQLEELIEQHYTSHAGIPFYAEKMGLSVKQLHALCREALNKTPSDLLRDRLVLEARRLLVHAPLTVTEVAARLGFFDNSYFARFFKKQTGQTPAAFRQNLL